MTAELQSCLTPEPPQGFMQPNVVDLRFVEEQPCVRFPFIEGVFSNKQIRKEKDIAQRLHCDSSGSATIWR